MAEEMAMQLVSDMYTYYNDLQEREPVDGLHIVYEDEYDILKNLYHAAFKAVSRMPVDTRNQKIRIDELLDGALTDVEYFLIELANLRKTD